MATGRPATSGGKLAAGSAGASPNPSHSSSGPEEVCQFAGALDRMDEGAVRDHSFERVEPKLEGCGDPEVGACAPETPEQVRVLILVGVHEATVRRHDVDRQQVVDREPELPLQAPHTAPERQPGGPGVRDDADRADEPERLRLVVELREDGTAVHPRSAARWIDAHAAHPREIDHDPVVAGRKARNTVPAAAYGDG
jgi:hypothetical protein